MYTFGKYIPTNKNVEVTPIEHVQKITLYSRLIEEVKRKFTVNKNRKIANEVITIIKLDISPSFLK